MAEKVRIALPKLKKGARGLFWVKNRTDLRSGVREFRNGFLKEMELELGWRKNKKMRKF